MVRITPSTFSKTLASFAVLIVACHGAKHTGDGSLNSGDAASSPSDKIISVGGDGNGKDGSSGGGGKSGGTSGGASLVGSELDALSKIPMHEEQMAALCKRPGADKIRTVFCAPNPPVVKSLVDLQKALGLSFVAPAGANAAGGNPGFVLTGHSSSLVSRFTSAINPRAVVFTPALAGQSPAGTNLVPNPEYVAMGFVRGEQFAEVATLDTGTKKLSLFLVRFEQACNSAPGGCTHGDLLTPAIEKNWTGNLTIYEDEELKNTIFDCKQCHQPGGTGTPKFLRMQERQNPWTHFMRNNRPGGQALLADFHAAHGTTEDYAGIPAAMIDKSDPAKLEALVENNGFAVQPNEFKTSLIEAEVVKTSAAQPVDNSTPGVSATWQGLYAKFVTGEVIALPYHDVKVSDKTKLATMTTAYKSFLAGTTPAAELPDIREVFLDSAKHEMGFAVKPGLDAPGILINACKQCHNSSLDQSLSRAKFNVDLTLMSAEEKKVARERIHIKKDSKDFVKQMPPERFRELTPQEIDMLDGLLQ